MRRGNTPIILLDKHGEIFAISTGSDATAEHECGSQALQAALCAQSGIKAYPSSEEDKLVADIRAGKQVEYPSLIERKTINQNLDKLTYKECVDEKGEHVAVFGYSPTGVNLDNSELRFWRDDEKIVGAWDDRSFAIKVRGGKLVGKLRRFADLVKAGKGLFAGSFLSSTPKQHLAGVIIAVQVRLRPEHKQAIAIAQAKWEASIRLKAKSKVEALYLCYRELGESAQYLGHIWPVWKDGVVDGDVEYALNPGYGLDAQYYGPYSFEQLRDWILARYKYPLRPIQQAA